MLRLYFISHYATLVINLTHYFVQHNEAICNSQDDFFVHWF